MNRADAARSAARTLRVRIFTTPLCTATTVLLVFEGIKLHEPAFDVAAGAVGFAAIGNAVLSLRDVTTLAQQNRSVE